MKNIIVGVGVIIIIVFVIGGYFLMGDKTYNGDIDFRYSTSSEDLDLPKILNGDLVLSGLTSAEGLILPETFSAGWLHLRGLTSTKGLDLSETTVSQVWFRDLTSADIEELEKRYPKIKMILLRA